MSEYQKSFGGEAFERLDNTLIISRDRTPLGQELVAN
jgi:hypothetical protein